MRKSFGIHIKINTDSIKKVFSMVELLVVIAVITILVALLFPALTQVKNKGQQISCINNLKQMGIANNSYVNDYNDYVIPYCYGTFWTSAGILWVDKYVEYTGSYKIMKCSSDKTPCSYNVDSYGINWKAVHSKWNISYRYSTIPGYYYTGNLYNNFLKITLFKHPSKTVIMHDGTNSSPDIMMGDNGWPDFRNAPDNNSISLRHSGGTDSYLMVDSSARTLTTAQLRNNYKKWW